MLPAERPVDEQDTLRPGQQWPSPEQPLSDVTDDVTNSRSSHETMTSRRSDVISPSGQGARWLVGRSFVSVCRPPSQLMPVYTRPETLYSGLAADLYAFSRQRRQRLSPLDNSPIYTAAASAVASAIAAARSALAPIKNALSRRRSAPHWGEGGGQEAQPLHLGF